MIWRWLERHAGQTPERIAIWHAGRSISYRELASQVAGAASRLQELGIRRGDRVALLAQNDPAQLVLLFACAPLGAILLPLNWRLAAPELRFILADAGARLLVTTPELRDAGCSAAPPGCAVRDAVFGEGGGGGESTGDDPLLLVYTSGTTGRPKGAVLDQRAVLFNALNAAHAFDLTARDRILTVLPMFHVGGLNIQTIPALYAGAEVILHPRFDPDAFFDSVAFERPTLSLLVPAVMRALVEHPRWAGADLGSLRAVGAGSSEVPLALIEAFHAKGVPVQQVYGATETCPIAIVQTAADALAVPGSIGRPALHAECRIVGPDGAEVPAGMEGEIQVRGPSVMRGYWGRDDGLLPGGWFATGDIGRLDAGGCWWFTDRAKHVIISGGENIYPAEVERVLAQAPGVAECAVVGRADPRWGEVPVAVVMPGPRFERASVLAHFEGRLARFKHPRDLVVVASLPRTALGKIAMAELKALIAERGERCA